MNKRAQVLAGFRNIYNKMSWLNKLKMEDCLKGYKSSEVHCIEYIAGNSGANVTTLAQYFYMTSGAISKLTKKLLKKGLIESYRSPDNKKEIYFKLTKRGKAVNKTHESLHKEFAKRDKVVFDSVTAQQFDSILSFVEKYNKHLDTEINKRGAK
ncbi:DNA-binding MarR family transcriptional regulator [Elusimicrobium simillimum]|uniref:MarR family transcriptional regulator n=1 Tax=Elusimicrobium simillimum TaxID=3143438 RepID=UPI003C6FB7FE